MKSQILAESAEQFQWIKEGYEQFRKNFDIKAETELVIRPGINLQESKKRIDIAPLNYLGEVLEVRKESSDLEWSLLSSGKGEWKVEGPDYNYTIHERAAEILVIY
ncbi:Uncharacterised protein [uncultured archaeon]|nr:Uncharacterised protein [uncultured archaeon]